MALQEIMGILFVFSTTYLIVVATILGIVWVKTYKIINPESSCFKLALNHIQFNKDFFFGLKEPPNASDEIHELHRKYKKFRQYCLIGLGTTFTMIISLIVVNLKF